MGVIDFLMKLVILSLPIFAIPMLLKGSSNVMGKIGGMVQSRGSKMTSGFSDKAKENAKLRRSETDAKRTLAGYDASTGTWNNSGRNRVRRWAGSRGAVGKARRDQRQSEAERILQGAVYDDMGKNADKYYGVGGDRRAGAYSSSKLDVDARINATIDKAKLKAQIEEMEPAKLELEAKKLRVQKATQDILTDPSTTGGHSYKAGDKEQALQAAWNAAGAGAEGDAVRAAVADLAMQNGGAGRGWVDQFANSIAGNTAEAQSFAQHLGEAHYQALESSAPELTEFINSSGQNQTTATNTQTYKKVTAQTIGKLDAGSLGKGLAMSGAIDDKIILEALTPQNAGSLPTHARQALEAEKARRGI